MNRLAILLLTLAASLLANAGPLEDFCRSAYTNGTHSASVVHAQLLEREPVTTNQTRRAANQADEIILRDLIVPDLIGTNTWEATAHEDRAALVAQRLDNRLLAANNDRKRIDALVLGAQIKALEDRLARRGGDPYGPLAGQSTEQVTLPGRGRPRWRALGLDRAPTPAEVRAALKPAP